MMQSDQHRHVAFPQSAQHVAIFFDGFLVPCIGHRLDAAPLNRETMRVLSSLCGTVEILAPASAPPIGGETGLAVRVSFLLPLPPLIVSRSEERRVGKECRS